MTDGREIEYNKKVSLYSKKFEIFRRHSMGKKKSVALMVILTIVIVALLGIVFGIFALVNKDKKRKED